MISSPKPYKLFEDSNVALRLGDNGLGLAEEGSPVVLDTFACVDQPWESYRAIIEGGVDSGAIKNEDLEQLDVAALDVLNAC